MLRYLVYIKDKMLHRVKFLSKLAVYIVKKTNKKNLNYQLQ